MAESVQEFYESNFTEYPVVSVSHGKYNLPSNFKLYQNYPNPFNPITTIEYSIPQNMNSETSSVKIIVYDILGSEVATLVNKPHKPGNYKTVFDASNLSSAIYFYRLKVGNFVEVKKMILLK